MTVLSRMKTIAVSLLLLTLVLGVSACGANKSSRDNGQISSSGPQDTAKSDAEGSKLKDGVSNQERLDQEERVLMYLEQTVPEVKEFRENIEDYNNSSHTRYGLIMRVDAHPDPQSTDMLTRDYYYIYVGSDMGTHTSRWNSFYVEKDLSAVLVENLTGGSPLSLEEWRQVQFTPPTNEN
ncbi:MAG: hypothetical protein GXY34_06320 [Syntrophomonadaceae bacterium]|nr:hypothetical protein [Syntrophomonadaceae bacterium]